MKKLLLLALGLCGVTAQAITPEASAYLDTALGHLEKHFLRTERVDWQAVRTGSRDIAKDAKTFRDTYPAIRWAISQLNEPHSFFLEPQQVTAGRAAQNQETPTSGQLGKIGFVRLPAHGSDGSLAQGTYQDTVHDAVRNLDQQGVCGWLVDLSSNGGGNMYPMIAGLGALLGEGEHGVFLGARKTPLVTWGYKAGAAVIGNTPLARVERPYQLKTADAPVAVMISKRTGSSGEATAISFIGRPNTRFFGEATYGFTTGNIGVPLEDKAILVITSSEMADRNAKTYAKIRPDEPSRAFKTNDNNHPAMRWLMSQPSCQKQ
jgi:carboxyl-terminal processing protease